MDAIPVNSLRNLYETRTRREHRVLMDSPALSFPIHLCVFNLRIYFKTRVWGRDKMFFWACDPKEH